MVLHVVMHWCYILYADIIRYVTLCRVVSCGVVLCCSVAGSTSVVVRDVRCYRVCVDCVLLYCWLLCCCMLCYGVSCCGICGHALWHGALCWVML